MARLTDNLIHITYYVRSQVKVHIETMCLQVVFRRIPRKLARKGLSGMDTKRETLQMSVGLLKVRFNDNTFIGRLF